MRSPSMAEAVQAEPRHPEQAQELNNTIVALIIDDIQNLFGLKAPPRAPMCEIDRDTREISDSSFDYNR